MARKLSTIGKWDARLWKPAWSHLRIVSRLDGPLSQRFDITLSIGSVLCLCLKVMCECPHCLMIHTHCFKKTAKSKNARAHDHLYVMFNLISSGARELGVEISFEHPSSRSLGWRIWMASCSWWIKGGQKFSCLGERKLLASVLMKFSLLSLMIFNAARTTLLQHFLA